MTRVGGTRPGGPVFVAEHEPEVAEMTRRYLERAAIPVRVTGTAAGTLAMIGDRAAELFVIDLTMPGLDLRRLRRALITGAQVPVVFLVDSHAVRPRGLSGVAIGDRRWVSRPFGPRTLVTAVTELLRPPRRPMPPPSLLQLAAAPAAMPGQCAPAPPVAASLPGQAVPGVPMVVPGQAVPAVPPAPPAPAAVPGQALPAGAAVAPWQSASSRACALPSAAAAAAADTLTLDADRRVVAVAGQAVPLTRTEFALIAALASRPGRVLSRPDLLAALEDARGKSPGPRAVDVYVTQLRTKLPRVTIRTVRGVGYVLEASP